MRSIRQLSDAAGALKEAGEFEALADAAFEITCLDQLPRGTAKSLSAALAGHESRWWTTSPHNSICSVENVAATTYMVGNRLGVTLNHLAPAVMNAHKLLANEHPNLFHIWPNENALGPIEGLLLSFLALYSGGFPGLHEVTIGSRQVKRKTFQMRISQVPPDDLFSRLRTYVANLSLREREVQAKDALAVLYSGGLV